MYLGVQNKVQAIFKFEVSKPNSDNIVKESAWFKNIVLDQGLQQLGYTGVIGVCRVGSGSSTPDKAQTALDNQVASTGQVESESNGVNSIGGYVWVRRKFRFGTGSAAGNLTEVGVGWAATGNTLFNRALIRDTENNPTTVTVLSDEVLDVTVELRAYVSLLPTTSSVTISDVRYNLKIQAVLEAKSSLFQNAYYCDGATGYSGAITGSSNRPSGAIDGFGVTNLGYNPGSLKKRFDIYWGLTQGNAAPLKTIVSSTPYCTFQVEIDPPIPKTAETVFKLTQEVSWGRYE